MFGDNHKLVKQLSQEGGSVARATVIDAHMNWSSAHQDGFNRVSNETDHVKVTLRVEPEGQEPFETTFRQAFKGDIPMKSWQCKAIFDPNDHSKIAILEDSIQPGGFSPRQADTGAAVKKAVREAAKSGDAEAYMRDWTAKAKRGEIPGVTRVTEFGAAPAKLDVADALGKLADLRDRGVLTDAQFETQKAKLLEES